MPGVPCMSWLVLALLGLTSSVQDPHPGFGAAVWEAARAGRADELARLVRGEPARAAGVVRDMMRIAARAETPAERERIAPWPQRVIEAIDDEPLRQQLARELVRWRARDDAQWDAARAYEAAMRRGQEALAGRSFAAAVEAAGDALAAAELLAEPYLSARARGLRGAANRELSRWDRAIEDLSAAAQATRELRAVSDHRGDLVALALAHEGRAYWCGARADYQGSLADFLRARELWTELDDRPQVGRCLVMLGGAFSELARFADAESALDEALTIFVEPGAARARTLTARALCDLDQGRPATGALRIAAGMAQAAGDVEGEAEARRQLGYALLADGQLAAADEELARAFEMPSSPLRRALAATGRGDAARLGGDPSLATAHYERAIVAGEDLPEGTWRAHTGLGRLAEAADPEAALAHYLAAIDSLEQLRRMLRLPLLRERALIERRTPYVAAARAHARAGDLASAFATLELLQARSLWEAGTGGSDSTTSARLRAIEVELAECEMAIEKTPPEDRAELLARRADLRGQHELERLAVRLARPRAGIAAGRSPATLGSVQASLPSGHALLAFAIDDPGGVCLVVKRDSVRCVRLRLDTSAATGAIDELLEPMADLAEGRVDTGNLRFSTRAARRLYDDLIRPLPLAGIERLWIVADGPLRRLPFAMLVSRHERRPVDPAVPYAQYRGCRFLAEDFEIAMLPAAALLATPAPSRVRGDAMVLGHGPPGAIHEADRVASLLRVEPTAPTEPAVAARAAASPTLHFAAHAELDASRPAFARIRLRPDGASDGWLHAFEVAGLDLAASPLVVLSGCDTAGHAGAADGLLGLLRAFLAAGARAVVATAWPVADRASAALMERFYDGLAAGDAVAALARAQREMVAAGRLDASGWSHPYFWAGYAVHGRP